MSTIWTPGGEYTPQPQPEEPAGRAARPPGPDQDREPSPEEMEAMAAQVMAMLSRPMSDHVLDLVEQLMQLAQLQLNRRALTGGAESPDLAAASLAIDTLGAVVDGVGSRLGEYYQPLVKTVDQLRMAFVEVSSDKG